jgi:hypothetical protein
MFEDEVPDLRGLHAHRSPDDDGKVGVDSDAKGPATGAAITIRNVGRLPCREVGKAFGHGRIIRKEEGKRKGFVEERPSPLIAGSSSEDTGLKARGSSC